MFLASILTAAAPNRFHPFEASGSSAARRAKFSDPDWGLLARNSAGTTPRCQQKDEGSAHAESAIDASGISYLFFSVHFALTSQMPCVVRENVMPKLNWKLLTKKRGSSTQGLVLDL